MRDIDGLDTQGCLGKAEGLLDLMERLAAGGEIARATCLVQGQALLGIGLCGLEQVALGTALRHADVDPLAPAPREPLGDVGGDLDRKQHLRGALSLLIHQVDEEPAEELAVIGVVDALHDIAPLAADAPLADVEDLEGRLELVT